MPVKVFQIFDEKFQLGRTGSIGNFKQLKDFRRGSMTSAKLCVDVTLDPNNTSWGFLGRDEFDVEVWGNKPPVGEADITLVLPNKTYHASQCVPFNPVDGTNDFSYKIGHGKTSFGEWGHATGRIKVWLEVTYPEGGEPPSGEEPVSTWDKIKQWIDEHPTETALLGIGALGVVYYTQQKEVKEK